MYIHNYVLNNVTSRVHFIHTTGYQYSVSDQAVLYSEAIYEDIVRKLSGVSDYNKTSACIHKQSSEVEVRVEKWGQKLAGTVQKLGIRGCQSLGSSLWGERWPEFLSICIIVSHLSRNWVILP